MKHPALYCDTCRRRPDSLTGGKVFGCSEMSMADWRKGLNRDCDIPAQVGCGMITDGIWESFEKEDEVEK